MKRSELEHLIRASGEIAGDDEIIIVGSQAILGQYPNAPAQLLVSMEADIYPRNDPDKANEIDGAIGEGSPFHELHGYYAQGVGKQTAILPKGWEMRLVSINNENTNGVTGYCLEVHDLAISKIVAGRPKDREFLQELLRQGMVQKKTLLDRLATTKLPKSTHSYLRSKIKTMFVK